MSEDVIAPIAALVYRPTDHVEPILLSVAQALSERGVKLGGALQHDIPSRADDPCAMELQDLFTAVRFSMSQELGSGSEACRLDPDALARAGVSIRQAIEGGAELIIVNKFGAQEALGSGLRDEMAMTVTAGIPLLTAVGERFLAEWSDFTGGEAQLLPPDADAVLSWCLQVCKPAGEHA